MSRGSHTLAVQLRYRSSNGGSRASRILSQRLCARLSRRSNSSCHKASQVLIYESRVGCSVLAHSAVDAARRTGVYNQLADEAECLLLALMRSRAMSDLCLKAAVKRTSNHWLGA